MTPHDTEFCRIAKKPTSKVDGTGLKEYVDPKSRDKFIYQQDYSLEECNMHISALENKLIKEALLFLMVFLTCLTCIWLCTFCSWLSVKNGLNRVLERRDR
jgi:hypothetical protein